MFLRKILVFFFVLFLFLLVPKAVFAQTDFLTDVRVEYKIQPDGAALITHDFSLENASTNIYATSYNLVLDNIEPKDVKASEGAESLRTEESKKGDTTTVTVFFDEAIVGKGKAHNFSVTFTNTSFAMRTGEVWEISVPRLSAENNFRSYTVDLLVPVSFGNEAYISPKPVSTSKVNDYLVYNFDKATIEKTGITAGFGSFQVFSFTLNYHLENPLGKKSQAEIALPPDTALQRVYYQQIEPKPADVKVDSDGNWLAIYNLEPRERVDIAAKGAVQIFATVRPFPGPTRQTLDEALRETTYWQTSDKNIKELASRLQTPQEIYNYVSQTLTYDYSRVRPNVERLGAVRALASPQSAICMEFTDLFIALARSAGIPAREINGFAYTENPEIQPLSLVADVLHSWPEYWSETTKSWIPVDPTWASTTGGVDYFSKLDLRHFTFVIHGKDPLKPYPPGSYKLGSNPQKDVFVSFGQLPSERVSHPSISVKSSRFIPFASSKMEVTIANPGPVALYDLLAQAYFDNTIESQTPIEVLVPYSSTKLTLKVPFSFLGRNTPDTVTIIAGDRQVSSPTYKNKVIIYNLVAFFLILSILIVLILVKLKRINLNVIRLFFGKIITKIKNVRKNPFSTPQGSDNSKGL